MTTASELSVEELLDRIIRHSTDEVIAKHFAQQALDALRLSPSPDGNARVLREALKDTVNRFEYAASMFHNVTQWASEEAPDGSNLDEWVWAPSRAALSTAPVPTPTADLEAVREAAFQIGDRVTKTKGSRWTGRIVGTYSTALTPEGYAIESENEPGSVQIYPAAAIRSMPLPGEKV